MIYLIPIISVPCSLVIFPERINSFGRVTHTETYRYLSELMKDSDCAEYIYKHNSKVMKINDMSLLIPLNEACPFIVLCLKLEKGWCL